ncbi:hypothetical protein [Campylobacter geochelonis]|uniref:hypothetical protein n=1 Tax=Campylobacter geochelonis TaxID=1780362 RepID=UPI0007707752|nr:hypothetical protein [Campylobacter geochelonis]CZE46253.1 Uncharacterised protein [Campylobacter geochelonis]
MSCAVYIDIAAKQNYIFSSNKLKDIVGASEIIRQVTNKDLEKTFVKKYPKFKEPDGNFGGGNALLFFDDEVSAKDFIRIYSKHLLEAFPSLTPYFLLDAKFDKNNYQESINKTHEKLEKLKNSYFPLTQPLNLGIESLCPNSDFPAIVKDNSKSGKSKFYSKSTMAKRNMSEKANANFNELFNDVLINKFNDKFCFSLEIDKIIHDENSYAAIVHIDANELGSRVKQLKSFNVAKEFSQVVDTNMKKAMEETIKILASKFKNGKFDGEFFDGANLELKTDDDKFILPFRPVVLSGDDLTFISEGRLGVFIARTFINELKKLPLNFVSSDDKKLKQPLFASGGIAIVKAKTPFFKGYTFAEELTTSAKKLLKESTNKDEKTSIDFFILSSGILGEFDDVRKRYFTKDSKELYNGGYSEADFARLVKLMQELKDISKNKIMKLRDLAFESEESVKKYLEVYCDNKLIKDNKLEFEFKMLVEAIELMKFYPIFDGEFYKGEQSCKNN